MPFCNPDRRDFRPQRLTGLGARLAVACLAVGLGCSNKAESSNPDTTLPNVADDSCARFGFGFNTEGCSTTECLEPLCSCPAPIRCIPGKNGRCMTAVDCGVACAADPEVLLACAVNIKPCRDDGDCRDARCVVEPTATEGECESGQRGARCREDRDCFVGNCVAGEGGIRACSPGEEGDLCNRASDCQSGQCARATDAQYGACQS